MFKKIVPSIISLSRIAFLWPIYVYFPQYPFVSLLLFLAAALTDWLDGHLARKLNVESNFGAKLDPIIDKIFYFTMLWILYPAIPAAFWIFALTLPSEAMLTAIRFWPFSAVLKPHIPATDIGKMKMVLQSGAIAIILFGLVIDYWPMMLEGILIAFLAIPFSWASLWSHFQRSNREYPKSVR